MITYSRWAPAGAVEDVELHVRHHVSSVADPFDDPELFADRVRITHEPRDGGVLVRGELDMEPDAPYLRPDFDPDQEARDNPLSVPSIRDRP